MCGRVPSDPHYLTFMVANRLIGALTIVEGKPRRDSGMCLGSSVGPERRPARRAA